MLRSVEEEFAPLVDVTQLTIQQLFESEDTALARCVQRLVAGLGEQDSVLSAFQSFTS